ncbi:MAG: ABC transporter ATP-binding protein [Chloroflexi bacterium]|nr:ABC transporter ATP-binding protein [Chloroflexota bacterium]
MSASTEFVIETRGLSKHYKKVTALGGVDLKVPRNAIVGFLGPNGAGKTTAIKLLLGLARPTGGSAAVFGKDIVRESVEIRKRIGYLAQNPRYYDHMTAREVLRFKARFYYSGPADTVESVIAEKLDLAGLADKADRPIKGFSGGELQRLGIAQALINSPELLILDEPAASLDPMGRRDVLDILKNLRGQTSVFYSTHILSDVQRVSDTVIILDRGRLVAEAPIDKLLSGGGVVYTVVLRGDGSVAYERVSRQPWVSKIETVPSSDGRTLWQVSVSDEKAAEALLLRLVLADERTTVTEFGRKKYDLEEAFLNLVGGKNHD